MKEPREGISLIGVDRCRNDGVDPKFRNVADCAKGLLKIRYTHESA